MVNKRHQGSSYDSSFKIGVKPNKKIRNKKSKITSLHSKRAQMKIQQTAFMLIAITLFFVLVGIVILVFRVSNIKDTATVLNQENAMLLVSKLANSPEFSCGNSFGTSKVACVDTDKVMALKNSINNYDGFWGVSKIEIRKIYPESGEIECTTLNYPDCNKITLVSGTGYSEENFVSLCRKDSVDEQIYDKCELAKLIVGYESES